MDAMSIDMDVAGNTARSLGPRESCREVSPGETVVLDVTATNIPASHPIFGFSFRLHFPSATSFESADTAFLLASNHGSTLEPFLTPTLSPGQVIIDALDMSIGSVLPEYGSGVLARVTLAVSESAGSGVYPLTLEAVYHLDAENKAQIPHVLLPAHLALGVSCDDAPTPAPTPVITLTTTPTPWHPRTPTPTPIPTPSRTPRPTPVPTPFPTPIRPADCPPSPEYDFEVQDPLGDQLPSADPEDPRDILSVRGFGDSETFCLELDLGNVVDPALATLDHYVTVGFDTDIDAATGSLFGYAELGRGSSTYRRYLCRDLGMIGADTELALWNPEVPATYDGTSVTVEIPLDTLGGDPSFNFEVMLKGTDDSFEYATDCAPNGSSISSPDGAVVPPRDRDRDTHFDAIDNCPDTRNLRQQDADNDDIGDVCDPSPTHGFEILGFSGVAKGPVLLKGGEATIGWTLTTRNLYPWDSSIRIDHYHRLDGLPDSCSVSWPQLPEHVPMGSLERRTFRWETGISCDPATPPGRYAVSMNVTTVYEGFDYVKLGWDEASATATLRIR
jgi:hypothetical protein